MAASNFREKEQLGLFAPTDEPRRHQVAEAADEIRKRFGDRAVTRARLVGAHLPTPFEPTDAVERVTAPSSPVRLATKTTRGS